MDVLVNGIFINIAVKQEVPFLKTSLVKEAIEAEVCHIEHGLVYYRHIVLDSFE